MAGWKLSVRVDARDSLGRYLGHIHQAAVRTVEETARASAAYAQSIDPVKTGALRASTQPVILGGLTGGVVWGTNHWEYQDRGTMPHHIKGDVSFFWAREGRRWTPGHNTISHPGNPALHFTSRTQDFASKMFMAAARANFA
jgi:hypothetical protein